MITAAVAVALTAMTPLAQAAAPTAGVLAVGELRSDGKAVAAADVVALVYPNQDEMARGRTGDTFKILAVGATKTGARGQFAITANLAKLPAAYVGRGGRVDLEVVAADATREIRWNFTATPAAPEAGLTVTSTKWVLADTAGRARAATADVRLDLGQSTAWDLADDPARWVTREGHALGVARRDTAATVFTAHRSRQVDAAKATLLARASGRPLKERTGLPGVVPCFSTWGSWHRNRPEHFLNVYGWSGASGTVTEDEGVDHTLGVGASSDGFAHIHAAGTRTVSLQAQASQDHVVDASVWNRVNYRDLLFSCGPDQRRPVNNYDLLSNDWTRLSHVNYTASCATKLAGATFTTKRAKNVTYSGGVDIGPANVSAQSGYGNGMELKFSFTAKSRLCGNSKNGLLSSSALDARKP